MSQQDQTDNIIVNHKVLKQVADELLPASLFRGIHSRKNATWKPRMVVLTAMLMLVSGKKTLSAGFELGRKAAAKIFRWHQSPGESYQGFVTQLRKWHFELKLAVMLHLQEAMQDRLSDEWTIGGFVVIACDGSRVELSRTRSLENTYSPKKKKGSSSAKKNPKRSRGNGKKAKKKAKTKKKKTKSQSAESIRKKANSPQMWLTLMWHVGSGLPWDWRTGPPDSSERQHVQEMLPNLPQNTLITADWWTFNFRSTPPQSERPRSSLNPCAVIDPAGHWKFVSDYGEPWELDNLRTELTDLASVRPAKHKALAKKWDVWWEKFQNTRPTGPNAGPPGYRALGEPRSAAAKKK